MYLFAATLGVRGCPLVGLSQVRPLVAAWDRADASGGTRRDPFVMAGQPFAVLSCQNSAGVPETLVSLSLAAEKKQGKEEDWP